MMNKIIQRIEDMGCDVREEKSGTLMFLRCATVKIEAMLTVVFGVFGARWAAENMGFLKDAPTILAYLVVLPGALASVLAVGKVCRWLGYAIENAVTLLINGNRFHRIVSFSEYFAVLRGDLLTISGTIRITKGGDSSG